MTGRLRAALAAGAILAAGQAGAASFDLHDAIAEEDRPKPAAAAGGAFFPFSFPKGGVTVGFSAGTDDHHRPREIDPLARETEFDAGAFKPDPQYQRGYDPEAQIEIYGGKTPVDTVRPLLEIGRELYGSGEIGEGINLIGEKNRLTPQLLLFGDYRIATAYNKNAKKEVGQVANRLNLFFNLQLTGTERILMFWRPLQDGGNFTRFEFAGPDRDRSAQPKFEAEDEPNTLFFEGDLSPILAGLTDEYQSFDLPFSFGRMPLLFQNGVWMEDAFLGGAFTIPARNSASLGITNYDITFFGGFREITSDAFLNAGGKRDEDDASVFGVAGFFDVGEGYLELGYAYLDDQDHSNGDFSYHNLTAAFSKRYFGAVSNATRLILNLGQHPGGGRAKTADGWLLLSENAFITPLPLTLIPYANFWIGKDSPQSVARAGGAGGVLRNTGLAFESDNLTGFPTLDATGRDTMGGAIGVEYLFGLDQQLVAEVAAVFPWDGKNGPAIDNQYAFSVRYQRPLTNQLIFRADAMYGLRESVDDIFGVRAELRVKF